jgi:hypothetical protein
MENESVKLWACNEFGGALLGDRRRTNRLVKIAGGLANNVGISVSTSCGKGAAQSISNFFGIDEVNLKSVMENHINKTAKRSIGEDVVFAIQDTTSINYTSHKCLDTGPIGSNLDAKGLIMHTVLLLKPDKTPLGILDINIWKRDPKNHGNSRNSRKRPINDKESVKWINGLHKTESALPEDKRVIVIGDRESDLFALFNEPRRTTTDLLVRSCYNRSVKDDEFKYLYDALNKASEMGCYELQVPRRGNRPSRAAKMSVRVVQAKINPPRERTVEKYAGPLPFYCVWAKELDAPDGVEPLDWKLLTTYPVDDFQTAVFTIQSYSCRWELEEFHRILKTGCKVEDLQFETTKRLIPAIGVLSVVAWRVLYLSKKAKASPNSDASEVSSEIEREVLSKWLKSRNEKCYKIRTVKDFVLGVAKLGGFLGRTCDGMPGTKTLWEGLRKLEAMVEGYKLWATA